MSIYDKIRNMKTILIDDDEWIRNSMSIIFENEHCYLKTFETAEEALEELKHDRYEIIICDYKLPGIDGLEFFRKIKKKYPDSVNILITAYGNENLISKALDIGVNDVVVKPFNTKIIEDSLAVSLLTKRSKTFNKGGINERRTDVNNLSK